MSANSHRLYLLAGFIALLPLFALSFFTFPCADDWCADVFLRHFHGRSDAFNALYETYNGRFAANGVLLFSPLNFKQSGYSVWLFFQLLLFGLVFFLVAKNLFRYFGIEKGSELISLLSLLTALSALPQISEGLFWLTGSAAYLGGSIFLLLHIGSITYYLRKKHTSGFLFVFITAFLVQGWNEVQTVFVAAVYFIALIGFIIYTKKTPTWFIFSMIAISAGTLIMLLAPGNDVRITNYPDAGNVANSLFMSFAQTLRFLAFWLIHPSGIILAIIVMLKGAQAGSTTRLPSLSILISLLLFAVFIAAFLPYLTTGILGQHRTMNWSCIFCFLLLPLIWFQVGIRLKNIFHPGILKWSIPLFFVALAINGNFFTAGKDLFSGNAASYKNEQIQRNDFLTRRNYSDKNSIPKLMHRPVSISPFDVGGNGDEWIRDCMWESKN